MLVWLTASAFVDMTTRSSSASSSILTRKHVLGSGFFLVLVILGAVRKFRNRRWLENEGAVESQIDVQSENKRQ